MTTNDGSWPSINVQQCQLYNVQKHLQQLLAALNEAPTGIPPSISSIETIR